MNNACCSFSFAIVQLFILQYVFLGPSRIISRPNAIEIRYRGRNKTLVCKGFGFPPPNITWSGPLSSKTKGKATESGLVLTEVKLEDVGRYTCTARSYLGSDKAETILVVQNYGRFCVVQF